MLAIDGLLETLATVLGEMEVFSGVVEAERVRLAPFLASTTVLMEAVKRGAGRETAHEAIKEHSVAAAHAIRVGTEPDLAKRLAADPRIGLTPDLIDQAMTMDERFLGAAVAQADAFVLAARDLVQRIPGAADFAPGRIL
jgi:adenylosuccinate lyase